MLRNIIKIISREKVVEYVIDPTHIDDVNQKAILRLILQEPTSADVIAENQSYHVRLEDKKSAKKFVYKVKFTHSILKFETHEDGRDSYHVISMVDDTHAIADLLSSDNTITSYLLHGILEINPDGTINYQQVNQVLVDLGSIDPCNASASKRALLNKALHSLVHYRGIDYVHADEKHECYIDGIIIKFSLQNYLMRRPSIKNPDRNRFEIFGSKINKGNFKSAYAMQGYLLQTPSGNLTFHGKKDAVIILIHPLHMTADQNKLLARILKACEKENMHYIDGVNTVELDGDQPGQTVTVYFGLRQPILCRKSERNPDESRYEVVGRVIGEGKFKKVYRSDATLVPQLDGSLDLKDSNRVVCDQIHGQIRGENWPEEKALNEYSIGKLADYMHIKKPVIMEISGVKHSFTTERYLKGDDLHNVINSLVLYITFTIDQMIELSIALLRALRQLHDRGIRHLDIKPENIIIDISASPIQAYFFDFNLSKLDTKENRENGKNGGTFFYAAPEAFSRAAISEKTDIYSLGIVLAIIWGLRDKMLEADCNNTDKRYAQACNPDFSDLFKHINISSNPKTKKRYLSSEHMQKIKDLYLDMTRAVRDERCSVGECLEVFDTIRFERRYKGIDKKTYQLRFIEHKGVIEFRNKLDQLSAENKVIDIPFLNAIQEVFNTGYIPRSSDGLSLFIDNLAIRLFTGLTSLQSIMTKVKAVTDLCKQKITELQTMNKTIIRYRTTIKADDLASMAEIAKLETQMATTNKRCGEYVCDLDHVVILNEKLEKDLKILRANSLLITLMNSKNAVTQHDIDKKDEGIHAASGELLFSRRHHSSSRASNKPNETKLALLTDLPMPTI